MKQRKKTLRRAAAALLCALCCLGSVSAAGGSEDPVFTKSYLDSVFSGAFLSEVGSAANTALYDLEAQTLRDAAQQLARARAGAGESYSGSGRIHTARDDTVTLTLGARITPVDGSLRAVGSGLIDITAGQTISAGTVLSLSHTYFCADGRSGYATASLTGTANYRGSCSQSRSGQANYASMAEALSQLGLLRGTDAGFELNRPATRIEALVMFLRILGLEDKAQACTAANPFSDVPDWAARYAAYAYEQGLAKGIGGGLYGANNAVTAQDYLTLLLRALGHEEGAAFSWSTALTDAVTLQVLTAEEQRTLAAASFWRAQMTWLSWRALLAKQADHQLLLCALRDGGVVTRGQIAAAVCMVAAR